VGENVFGGSEMGVSENLAQCAKGRRADLAGTRAQHDDWASMMKRRLSMRAYVMTSGGIFGLIVVAHILRMVEEGPQVARDPLYVIATIVAVGFSVWSFLLLRLRART
jgi:hypothetical protein